MRQTLAAVVLSLAMLSAGCGAGGEKDKYKDLDRPVPAKKPAG